MILTQYFRKAKLVPAKSLSTLRLFLGLALLLVLVVPGRAQANIDEIERLIARWNEHCKTSEEVYRLIDASKDNKALRDFSKKLADEDSKQNAQYGKFMSDFTRDFKQGKFTRDSLLQVFLSIRMMLIIDRMNLLKVDEKAGVHLGGVRPVVGGKNHLNTDSVSMDQLERDASQNPTSLAMLVSAKAAIDRYEIINYLIKILFEMTPLEEMSSKTKDRLTSAVTIHGFLQGSDHDAGNLDFAYRRDLGEKNRNLDSFSHFVNTSDFEIELDVEHLAPYFDELDKEPEKFVATDGKFVKYNITPKRVKELGLQNLVERNGKTVKQNLTLKLNEMGFTGLSWMDIPNTLPWLNPNYEKNQKKKAAKKKAKNAKKLLLQEEQPVQEGQQEKKPGIVATAPLEEEKIKLEEKNEELEKIEFAKKPDCSLNLSLSPSTLDTLKGTSALLEEQARGYEEEEKSFAADSYAEQWKKDRDKKMKQKEENAKKLALEKQNIKKAQNDASFSEEEMSSPQSKANQQPIQVRDIKARVADLNKDDREWLWKLVAGPLPSSLSFSETIAIWPKINGYKKDGKLVKKTIEGENLVMDPRGSHYKLHDWTGKSYLGVFRPHTGSSDWLDGRGAIADIKRMFIGLGITKEVLEKIESEKSGL